MATFSFNPDTYFTHSIDENTWILQHEYNNFKHQSAVTLKAGNKDFALESDYSSRKTSEKWLRQKYT